MKNTEESIKVSKACLYEALKDTEDIVDNNQKDIVLLCQMLKDNISLWKTETNDDNNNNNSNDNNSINIGKNSIENNSSNNLNVKESTDNNINEIKTNSDK